MPGPEAVKVIAVTGGKGGVGKTSIAVNLATAFAQIGRRALLLDGDMALANVDVLLGLTPRYTLDHLIRGERTLEEIVVQAPQGFAVIPAASGLARLADLSEAEHYGVVRAFGTLAARLDVMIIDTAAGIASQVRTFAQASQEVVVVVCDEPASMTDAYALVKVLHREHGVRAFRIVANMVRERGAGRRLYESLLRVTGRFLDVTLDFAGEIPDDTWLRRSVREQRPVVDAFPAAPSAQALKLLARLADSWARPAGARGNIEFFAERLMQRRETRLEVVR